MNTKPFVSVVIPVYNGSKYLSKCLDAISASTYKTYEIIVVDDSSTDNSAEIARKKGATVFQISQQSGPAAARNYAAKKARGDILFFVDADVLVQKGTIARMVTDFNENPDIVAVFGSYDDKPAEGNFLSQYKNLSHLETTVVPVSRKLWSHQTHFPNHHRWMEFRMSLHRFANQEVGLNVNGMTCGGCENRVKGVLTACEGVKDVHVSHKDGKAIVHIEKGKANKEKLIEAVEKAGFTASEG